MLRLSVPASELFVQPGCRIHWRFFRSDASVGEGCAISTWVVDLSPMVHLSLGVGWLLQDHGCGPRVVQIRR